MKMKSKLRLIAAIAFAVFGLATVALADCPNGESGCSDAQCPGGGSGTGGGPSYQTCTWYSSTNTCQC